MQHLKLQRKESRLQWTKVNEMYDVAIIGGGVAGLAAAMYAARYNLKTVVVAKDLGGLIQYTHLVENYPGFSSISGMELAKKIEDHALSLIHI